MSIFLPKSASAVNQPWSYTWTPGASLANFFTLYNYHSLADASGNATISVAASIATALDGPIQVARFASLTVNAALTSSQRCRGLMPICDTFAIGASGSISMTALGAAGSSKWANKDIFVPQSITFTGKNTSYAQFLAWIKSTGYCIFDPTLYAAPLPGMGDVQCDWATWTPYGSTMVSAATVGAGLGIGCGYSTGAGVGPGTAGGAGTNAPGGGGGGAYYFSVAGALAVSRSGPGTPWGGGPGSGGASGTSVASGPADLLGGPGGAAGGANAGGGAGNPGGAATGSGTTGQGTGGILLVIARLTASLTAGHVIAANGIAGGTGASAGGGGSGGGKAGLYSLSVTGTPNLTATGGPAGTNAGAGGAGSTESKTFATMGW